SPLRAVCQRGVPPDRARRRLALGAGGGASRGRRRDPQPGGGGATEYAAGMTSHVFDDAVALEALGDGRFRGHTHPAYANMVGPFGGITAATLLRAVEQHPDVLGAPLSLTVNFAGPVADGEFEIEAVPVRTNRSTQHWSLRLVQGGAVTTTATAVFGQRRETWSDSETPAPDAPAPVSLEQQRMPDIVVWARNYEMRFIDGIMAPGARQESSSSTLWMRDSPAR